MDAPFSLPGLIVALFLPWTVGIALTRMLLKKSVPGRPYLLAGYGYFLGSFLATLVLRLFDALGFSLNFVSLAVALALLGVALLVIGRLRGFRLQSAHAIAETVPWSAKAVAGVLLALLAWRYLTMLGIIIEKPLFGWDAMMNWAPKAIVWFNNGELTDFVSPPVWLQESTATGPYTLGNFAASTYPEMVPLVYLWHMLGAGTWEHPLLQLPWLLAALNLGLALYGLLRMSGSSALVATIACYGLLSLPFINVHTFIGGYADLWLTAAFSLGAIILHKWEQRRDWGLALMILMAAIMCWQLKNPGIILGAILILGMLRGWLDLSWRMELCLIGPVLAAIVVGFLLGLKLQVPVVGLVSLKLESFQLGIFGPEKLEFHSQATVPVLRSLFEQANWHIFWYVAAATLLCRFVVLRDGHKPSTLSLILLVMGAFYFVVFFCSDFYNSVVTYVTFNRAILYPVPALLFYLFAWPLRGSKQHLSPGTS